MKRKILSGLLAMTLIASLAMPGTTASASGIAVGSSVNSNTGNGGVEIPQEVVKPEEPVKPTKPVKPTRPTIKPSVMSMSGASTTLSVVNTQNQEENPVTTQAERQVILKEAETSIMVTQSTVLEGMLDTYTERETTAQTSSEAAMEQLVENGVSVSDAVRTAAISSAVKNSDTVSETLENLSEDAKPLVQEAVKDSAVKLQEATAVKMNASKTALTVMEEMEVSGTEAVDVNALKEAMDAKNPEEAAVFEDVLDELESQNIVVTPAVIGQVIENQEEHQKALQESAEGNVDSLTVHSVIDISVSDDVKDMVSEEGAYVEVPVNMPGIKEETLVVALKPVQGTVVSVGETSFRDLQAKVKAGSAKEILKKLDNKFAIVPCTAYDGGVILEMTSFSPVMILTFADTTTEVASMAGEITGMETAADGRNILRPVLLAAAVIVVGTAAVYTAKKKSSN